MTAGDFPEVGDTHKFPQLESLRQVRDAEGDPREVSRAHAQAPGVIRFPGTPACKGCM